MTGDELLDTLSTLRRALRRGSARPSELAALSGAQLELVRLVRRQPGISVAEAAAELRVAANTVSTLVRQLTEMRVLVRRADPDDRRVARLDLSPGIRRKVEAWRDLRSETIDAALARLPQRDRGRIEAALPALAALGGELA